MKRTCDGAAVVKTGQVMLASTRQGKRGASAGGGGAQGIEGMVGGKNLALEGCPAIPTPKDRATLLASNAHLQAELFALSEARDDSLFEGAPTGSFRPELVVDDFGQDLVGVRRGSAGRGGSSHTLAGNIHARRMCGAEWGERWGAHRLHHVLQPIVGELLRSLGSELDGREDRLGLGLEVRCVHAQRQEDVDLVPRGSGGGTLGARHRLR